mgnify:CR=1 FL=1
MSPVLLVAFTWFGWFLAGVVRLGFLRGDDAHWRKVAELEAVTLFAVCLAAVLWLRGAA